MKIFLKLTFLFFIISSLILSRANAAGEQQELLKDDEKELRKTISKFEKDELEHHDIGLEHDAENAPGYKIMTKIIEIGCKTAIAISKKI